MKTHTGRLYVAAVTLLVFFVLWAIIAAHPWAAPARARVEPDPRLVALDRWERRLKREAVAVRRKVNRRWVVYRHRLKVREAQIAAARGRYAQELAAAAAARARIAALQQTAVVASSAGAAPASAPAPAYTPTAAAPASAPPPVRIVTLPAAPATRSTSSVP